MRMKEFDSIKTTVKKIGRRTALTKKFSIKNDYTGVDKSGALRVFSEEILGRKDCGHACEAKGVCAVCGSFYFCKECSDSRKFECASCHRLICPNCSKTSFFDRGVRFCLTCWFNGVISLALTRISENSGTH